MRPILTVLCLLSALGVPTLRAAIPSDCTQLIVATTDEWNSNTGRLQLFQRDDARNPWQPVSAPINVLFGKNGLAWGRGVAGQNEPGPKKREGDNRAPAGIFSLGKVFTDESALPRGADYPFHTVTPADCWIEDPALPNYNRHVQIDLANPPPWFNKQQMKQGDFAHRWKIEIHHNAGAQTIPGAGSAIFFHIQRGPSRHSAGCTTMPQDAILAIIRWLRTNANPHYVLLPNSEYLARQRAWNLPPPPE